MCSKCEADIKSEVISETVTMISRFNDPDLMFELASMCISSGNDMNRAQREADKERLFNASMDLSRHCFSPLYEALLKMVDDGDFEFDEAIAFCEEALKEKQADSEVAKFFNF